LRAYRDGGGRPPSAPSEDVVHEMMSFMIGQPVPPEYVGFLMAELSLHGEDAYARPLESIAPEVKQRFPS
jgi:hypothetical protein